VKKIIIIGSGSAGLITALMMNNKIQDSEIKIIRNKNEKVIGVGEATVGNFKQVLVNHIGIDFDDFVKNVNPISKHGIWDIMIKIIQKLFILIIKNF
jgi:tryptophan halogenase